jgi:hypothetical protein
MSDNIVGLHASFPATAYPWVALTRQVDAVAQVPLGIIRPRSKSGEAGEWLFFQATPAQKRISRS